MIDIAVIGAAAALSDAVALDDDIVAAAFDDATDTWLLRTASGEEVRAHVIIDGARRLHQPPPPNYPGHNEFRGPSLHWADGAAVFEPGVAVAGARVAVIGDRAAHVVAPLTACEVQLFDCPPNWQTRNTARRGLPRVRRRGRPHVVLSRVDRITPSGIRTADGADHGVDAIIYATGSAVAAGLPEDALVGSGGLKIQQAWSDSAAAYLGVAVHGFPN